MGDDADPRHQLYLRDEGMLPGSVGRVSGRLFEHIEGPGSERVVCPTGSGG